MFFIKVNFKDKYFLKLFYYNIIIKLTFIKRNKPLIKC